MKALGEGVLTLPPRRRQRHRYDTSHSRPIRRNVRMLAASLGIAALAVEIAPPEGGVLVEAILTILLMYGCVEAVSLLLATRRRYLSVRERYERRYRALPWLFMGGCAAAVVLGVAMARSPEAADDTSLGYGIAALGVVGLLGGIAFLVRSTVSPMEDVLLSVDPRRIRRGETVTIELRRGRGGKTLACGLLCYASYEIPWRQELSGLVLRGRLLRVCELSRHLRRVDEDTTRRIRIPPDAPFSFEGESLCVTWEAVALLPGQVEPLAAIEVPIEVLP